MTELIFDPNYWQLRLDHATRLDKPHHAVFCCGDEQWQKIEAKHREILKRVISFNDYVLDAGCGYGRLLTLMPPRDDWQGNYLGVDLSPAFIEQAARLHPSRKFAVADMRSMRQLGDDWFDVAVLISIRPMIKRHGGEEEWAKCERELRRVARKLLFLEYDAKDEGSLE